MTSLLLELPTHASPPPSTLEGKGGGGRGGGGEGLRAHLQHPHYREEEDAKEKTRCTESGHLQAGRADNRQADCQGSHTSMPNKLH